MICNVWGTVNNGKMGIFSEIEGKGGEGVFLGE
jgi:hypothetical protein